VTAIHQGGTPADDTAEPDPLGLLGATVRNRWASVRGPLFCDMYELTMAQVYVRTGLAHRPAQFDAFYRSNPDYGTHQAGYCISAGLGPFCDWLAGLRVSDEEIAALGALRAPGGGPLFGPEFLDWIADPGLFAELEIHAIGEGRVVHPNEPIVSVTGPLAAAQLIETALLNFVNYPTLIATKASRVVSATRGGRVLEFGMRRGPATGVNDGIRAALIGGCESTSNVEAAIATGYRPSGTLAHSLIQAFLALGMGELEAFRASAAAAPDECILLVDTIDTLRSGVPNAVTVFGELRAAGHEPVGVRLDSGDLAYLAVQTARLLDDGGFVDAAIVMSSDLDELTIWQIRDQIGDDARRSGLDPGPILDRLVYGVGTRLITSAGDSALNGVYKLVGIADADGSWLPAIKVSEDPGKVPLPSRKLVWRLYDHRGTAVTDLVGLADEVPLAHEENIVHHPVQAGVHKIIRRADIGHIEPLLEAVDVAGAQPSVAELAARCRSDVDRLDVGVQRLVNPHRYHVSVTDALHRLRADLLARLDDQEASRAP
jgi:nicotinate phosphoribosyltransferase